MTELDTDRQLEGACHWLSMPEEGLDKTQLYSQGQPKCPPAPKRITIHKH